MFMMAENGRMRTAKVSGVLVWCAVFMLLVWPGRAEGATPQVSAGDEHTVGLNTDGTVVAAGYDVRGWTDIVQVAARGHHTAGLKPDGTVVAAGDK